MRDWVRKISCQRRAQSVDGHGQGTGNGGKINRLREKNVSLLWILPLLLVLGGCKKTDLENKAFPLALGIDLSASAEGPALGVSWSFPDLSAVTQQDKNQEQGGVFLAKSGTFYGAERQIAETSDKVCDYNHVKAIVFGRDFFQGGKEAAQLLGYLESREVFSRNILCFLAEGDAVEILEMEKDLGGSVGNYLEDMVQNQKQFSREKQVTLGDLYNHWHNGDGTLLMPLVSAREGALATSAYGVLEGLRLLGTVEGQEADLIFLGRGTAGEVMVSEGPGRILSCNPIKRQLRFGARGEGVIVSCRIKLRGTVRSGSPGDENERMLLAQDMGYSLSKELHKIGEKWKQEQGIDIFNTFALLGSHDRALWKQYSQDREGYGRTVEVRFETELQLEQ